MYRRKKGPLRPNTPVISFVGSCGMCVEPIDCDSKVFNRNADAKDSDFAMFAVL